MTIALGGKGVPPIMLSIPFRPDCHFWHFFVFHSCYNWHTWDGTGICGHARQLARDPGHSRSYRQGMALVPGENAGSEALWACTLHGPSRGIHG